MSSKIVFLDASTINYGDIDFSPLKKLGELAIYPLTRIEDIAERCKDADIVITNKVVFTNEIIYKCPKLKMIAEAATGYNNIDIASAAERNIAVANVPGYSTTSVAQITLSFMLALSTNLLKYNEACHNGEWSRSEIFTMGNWPYANLEGKTVGIMGYGTIGREVARLCNAFGMKVVALNRNGELSNREITRVSLYDLAAQSDFISIHMPLTNYSKHIVNKDFLSKMKPSAFLINIARGPIIDSAALLDALTNKTIAGAALDVMEQEPPMNNDPLLSAPNLIITPHIGWASRESRIRLVNEIAANIQAFLNGEDRNLIRA